MSTPHDALALAPAPHRAASHGAPDGARDVESDVESVVESVVEGDAPADAVSLAQAQLAQWHVQGAQRADPLRFAVIQAMAHRAVRHHGAARAVIDARLHDLISQYQTLLRTRGLPAVSGVAVPACEPAQQSPSGPVVSVAPMGPLGRLVDAFKAYGNAGACEAPQAAARPVPASAPTRSRPAGAGGRQSAKPQGNAEPAALPDIDLETVSLHTAATPVAALELQAVRRFRGTWSRLSAQERLRQTLAQVPPQAGPLNALHLLHRALVQMQDLSPDYLQHFVSHVDALLWLEQVHSAAMAPVAARSGSTARAIAARRKPPTRGS